MEPAGYGGRVQLMSFHVYHLNLNLVSAVFFLSGISLFSFETRLPDGSRYSGDLVNGLFEGRGQQYWENGDTYNGEYKKGLYNGFGVLTTSEYVYEGFFENGLMNGEGVLKLKSGSSFYGTFRNGYLNGMGRIVYQNGDKYEGNVVYDMKSGAGTYTKKNGDIYVGNFDNDMFNGFGTYYETNGNYYIGEFLDNFFNGYGKYVSKKNVFGDVVYEGVFENGNFPKNYYARGNTWKTLKDILFPCSVLANIILGVLLVIGSKHRA